MTLTELLVVALASMFPIALLYLIGYHKARRWAEVKDIFKRNKFHTISALLALSTYVALLIILGVNLGLH